MLIKYSISIYYFNIQLLKSIMKNHLKTFVISISKDYKKHETLKKTLIYDQNDVRL